ncbi:hypothetical protein JCM15765_19090 [Paradesulfitobacterium aromaticivorans]
MFGGGGAAFGGSGSAFGAGNRDGAAGNAGISAGFSPMNANPVLSAGSGVNISADGPKPKKGIKDFLSQFFSKKS